MSNEVTFNPLPTSTPAWLDQRGVQQAHSVAAGRGGERVNVPDREPVPPGAARPFRTLSATQCATWHPSSQRNALNSRAIRQSVRRLSGPVTGHLDTQTIPETH